MKVLYNHEYPRRVRLAAIGCGGHAIRNVFSTHPYAPIDLVAVCDLDRERAEHTGCMFGAKAAYTDYHEMLEREKPEAVTVVTNYDEDGRPRYPQIAIDCMQAGAHVWIEKPPAASSAEVLDMMRVSEATGKFVAVGFKKMFFPANVKAREIITRPAFGSISTITARYPEALPPLEDRQDLHKMWRFLDHIVHPWSVLQYLAGPAESIFVQRSPTGGTVTAIQFASGAVGSLHLDRGQGSSSFLERTEIVGPGGNVVIHNNTKLTFYSDGPKPAGGYGRSGDYYGGDERAALHWEPEFSLGQLYNKGIFLLGYAPEIRYFCQCVLDDTPPEVGTLDNALEMLRIYEAYCQPDGQHIRIDTEPGKVS
ncbi:Gfo/Idh/MocA family protein [Phycisphaerales bacterium AB-hyl4]|uniref:Gfo/Idh/MocA family protein n=1 Tax=Natronomicrosphaera hydrolytica TaxID=3242702 RepID=A0ABV4U591_9BACT